jgi:aspartate/glutamate racemase
MTQSNNSKIQTRPIEDLIGRIRTLRQQGQKQLVIPIAEANKLADSLTQVMTRMVTIQEEIIEALKVAQQASTVSIEMDGGDFSKDK